MKKIISALMMSVFFVTGMSIVLPYNAYAQTYEVTKQNGGVKAKFWYYIVDDHVEIEGIRAYEDELTIPAEIEGYPVKMLRKGASISDNKELKSLNIEDGIEEVNLHASYCSNLVNVHLPDTLQSGDFSFFLDTALESITIPGGLETIPYGMCNQCDSLKNVTIENGVKVIGKEAFSGCPALERITIPDSVYLIDDNAFSGYLQADGLQGSYSAQKALFDSNVGQAYQMYSNARADADFHCDSEGFDSCAFGASYLYQHKSIGYIE